MAGFLFVIPANPGKQDAWIGVLGIYWRSARKHAFPIRQKNGTSCFGVDKRWRSDQGQQESTADRIIINDKPFEDTDALDEFTNSVRVATVRI